MWEKRSVDAVDKIAEQYYQLKMQLKEIEQEMASLRKALTTYCEEKQANEMELGGYKLRIVRQERKEYDESKLFEALPDLEVWRMLSKPDTSKIASLVKLHVIPEEKLRDTYSTKKVTLLQVDKL